MNNEREYEAADEVLKEIRMGDAMWYDGQIIRDPKRVKEIKSKILAQNENS